MNTKNQPGGYEDWDKDDLPDLKYDSFSIAPIIGFGAWKDEYNQDSCGVNGHAWNIIFLCFRIQFVHLKPPVNEIF